MFIRHCLKALGLICLVLPFTGCSSSGIDSITLSPTLTDFDGTGGTLQLTAIATIGHGAHPATYEDVTKLVTWSTPLADVAAVNADGLVTIVGLGLTPINATIHGFTGVVSATSTVCATIPSTATTPSPVICPAASTPSFKPRVRLALVRGVRKVGMPGETIQFRVIGTSTENGDQSEMTESVAWTSTDESVATVSRSGLVTAVGPGKATIMATLVNEDKTAVAAASTFTVAGSGR